MTTLTAYLDPNYDPAVSYPRLEGWLLLYDKIYLANPSPHQIERAADLQRDLPVSHESIQRLVSEKLVVPVGRPRFFEPQWRNQQSRAFQEEDVERAAHFGWSEEFDAVVSSHARRLDEAGLDGAIEAALSLEKSQPKAFAALSAKVAALRAAGRLPTKFYNASQKDRPLVEIVRGVLYEVAGDIWLRGGLDAHMILPRDYGPLYAQLDHLTGAGPSAADAVITEAEPTVEDLSESEMRLAQEFADRLANHYTLADILPEFRGSALQRSFRAFVAATLQNIRHDVVDRARGEILWDRFDRKVQKIELEKELGSWALGTGTSLALGSAAVERFHSEGTRRFFLMTALAMVGSAVITRPFFMPAAESMAATIAPQDRWIALIAGHATRR